MTSTLRYGLLFQLALVACSSNGSTNGGRKDGRAHLDGSEAGEGGQGGLGQDAGARGGTSGAKGGESGQASDATAPSGNGGSDGGGTVPTRDGSAGRAARLIATTVGSTCILDPTGAISCWGAVPPANDLVQPPTGTFTALSGQDTTFAALAADGSMFTFANPSATGPTQPIAGHWDRVAMGTKGTICALSSGMPTCAGVPSDVPAGSFDVISAGTAFACGIESKTGAIHCWGDAGEAYTTCIRGAPQEGQLDAPSGAFTSISSGPWHSCAVRTDHTIACWGAGAPGAPPTKSVCNQRFNYGQSSPPAGAFASVSAGQLTSCAVRMDGTLACWGAGQSTTGCGMDVDGCGEALPPAGTFSAVAVGYTHACAIRTDGKVACWGSDTGGRATPPEDLR